MINWNAQFTQLIRKSNHVLWGNWTLSSEVAPGAVGILDPSTGAFKLIAASLPDISSANLQRNAVSSDWEAMTSDVSKSETAIDLGAEITDPETGVTGKAGVDVAWKFGKEGSMTSKCAMDAEVFLKDFDSLARTHMDWLIQRADQCGMGASGGIAQGFGIVTSVLYAKSGLNVGSLASDNTFSLKGSASAVHKMLGEAQGKGSYTSSSATKSVDKHLWPSEAGVLAAGSAPLAFTFASFGGRLILPRWIGAIGAFRLILDNSHGGTYVVKAKLDYDSQSGHKTVTTDASGGLTATIGDIPLDATNLKLAIEFVCVGANEKYSFEWSNPRGQWVTGVRHIDVSGVWPGATKAVDREAGN
jgi:hypothetical protein